MSYNDTYDHLYAPWQRRSLWHRFIDSLSYGTLAREIPRGLGWVAVTLGALWFAGVPVFRTDEYVDSPRYAATVLASEEPVEAGEADLFAFVSTRSESLPETEPSTVLSEPALPRLSSLALLNVDESQQEAPVESPVEAAAAEEVEVDVASTPEYDFEASLVELKQVVAPAFELVTAGWQENVLSTAGYVESTGVGVLDYVNSIAALERSESSVSDNQLTVEPEIALADVEEETVERTIAEPAKRSLTEVQPSAEPESALGEVEETIVAVSSAAEKPTPTVAAPITVAAAAESTAESTAKPEVVAQTEPAVAATEAAPTEAEAEESPVELSIESKSFNVAILSLPGEVAVEKEVESIEEAVAKPAGTAKPTGHWETKTVYHQVCRGRGRPCDWVPVTTRVWVEAKTAAQADVAVASPSDTSEPSDGHWEHRTETQQVCVGRGLPCETRTVSRKVWVGDSNAVATASGVSSNGTAVVSTVSYPCESQPATAYAYQGRGGNTCLSGQLSNGSEQGGLLQRIRQARQNRSCSNGGFRPFQRIGSFLRGGRRCG